MTFTHNRYTALVFAAIVIGLLWVAHFLSAFSLLNGFAYDGFMRSFPSTASSEKMIVIETNPDYAARGDDVWVKLLTDLLASDAAGIAFTFFPQQTSREFYQLASTSNKLIFGAHLVQPLDTASENEFLLPKTALSTEIEYGLISRPPSQHGVFREQHGVLKANGIEFPGFEKRVAEIILPQPHRLPDADFRVNFIGNQYRIPKIKIERILNDGLINELVSGRTVLVGYNKHQSSSEYYTPVSTDDQKTSDVMFHAFALDTLLSDRQIEDLPGWGLLLLLVVVTVASIFLGQWLGFGLSIMISLIISLIYVLICWSALGYFYLWIPIVEILLAQWISFFLVWGYRVNQEQKSLEQMLFGFPLKSREKGNPVSLYNSDEPWELLISIINQSLNLNRIIFLERIPGDHRLKEIKASNCSMDDILEKRRDYQRTPYSRAISANRPILLDSNYLKEIATEEQQYMAPLIFAGEVLGFWVFTVEPDKIKSYNKFHALTYSFMVQVSETLHYRHEWFKRFGNEKNKLWSYLRVTGNEQIQQLNQSATLMDKRVYELQEVFNSINTSCVLYDLFGHAVMANRDMDELARQANIRLFNISMLEFIVDITEFDEASARDMIQRVIFDHESKSIPVSHKAINRSFMLHILPLRYDDSTQQQRIPNESQVFQISGVLCELVDVTDLKQMYQLKEKMFERFYFQLNEDLQASLLTIQLPDNETLKDSNELVALRNIRGKINQMLEMLQQLNTQMNVDIEHLISNNLLCFPIDAKIAIQNTIESLQDTINQREIKINYQLPDFMSLVFASPVELEAVLHSVLQTLIEDTYEGSEIWISVEEREHLLTCHLQNAGIGISNAKPEKLTGDTKILDTDVLNFNYAIHCVNRWGGSLNISSETGEGSRVDLVLRCFL